MSLEVKRYIWEIDKAVMKYKSSILRSCAMLLASMIFVSSTGLCVSMHFCGNHLRSLSLIGEAKSCVEKASSCQRHTVKVEDKRCPIGCCTDKTIAVEVLEDIFIQGKLAFSNVDLVKCNVAPFMNAALAAYNEFIPSPLIYKPPKIIKSIYAFVQSFLL